VGFAEPPPAKRRSEARERLLAAASLLFYAEGIAEHRQWCYQFLRRAFEDAGHQLPPTPPVTS
jgi:hypothetical protein